MSFKKMDPDVYRSDGHIRASLATSPGGKEHGSNKQHGNVGYSVRQPRYLRYLSKTGGFASPPLGGFALSLSKAGQSGTAFQRGAVNRVRMRRAIDGLRTSGASDTRFVTRFSFVLFGGGDRPFMPSDLHCLLEPLELMARLAALVPPPRMHFTRFHGVFAPPGPDSPGSGGPLVHLLNHVGIATPCRYTMTYRLIGNEPWPLNCQART